MAKGLKKQFGLRLGDEQVKTLEEIANAEERSIAAVIRRFIDEGIKKRTANTGKAEGTVGLQS
jgi:hypothetical protein